MKFKQLSLFLENKPAHLKHPCDALAKADINILTLCLADSEKFGIMRLIIKEWEKARDVLTEAGCVVNVTDVLGIEVPDHPGGLAELLAVIEKGGHDIEYMYAFALPRADKAILFFRFKDTDAALATLQESGVPVLDPVDL